MHGSTFLPVNVNELPRINTPTGGWTDEMPGPFLSSCSDPLVEGAPDLRGTWRAVSVTMKGEDAPRELPLWKHVERIEQAGDRIIITSDGVVHDFIHADGTPENGCHDVAAIDMTTRIVVAAAYEDGVFVLRPQGMDGTEVRRWREGDRLGWDYAGIFRMLLERID